jgi:hypothetical protein
LCLVRRDHQIVDNANGGTDVFDMSCPDAQRLFPTSKKNKRRETNIPPQLINPRLEFKL